MRNTSRPSRRRHAAASLELILVLPIALAFVLAVLQFSMLAGAQHQLAAASREGARLASLDYSQQEIEKAIKEFLGPGRLEGVEIEIKIEDESQQPIRAGRPVEVTLRISANEAVPNLLAFIGFSFGDNVLSAKTVMRKE